MGRENEKTFGLVEGSMVTSGIFTRKEIEMAEGDRGRKGAPLFF